MDKCIDKHKGVKYVMKALRIAGFVLLGAAFCFLFGLVIMLLWNWLMPMIFGLTTLTYWQSVGVLALASLLFGRFGGRSGDHDDDCKKQRKHPIRDSIKEEIKKEFEKEFEKEYGKKQESESNENYDDMYEKWWAHEGERLFEEYMKSNNES